MNIRPPGKKRGKKKRINTSHSIDVLPLDVDTLNDRLNDMVESNDIDKVNLALLIFNEPNVSAIADSLSYALMLRIIAVSLKPDPYVALGLFWKAFDVFLKLDNPKCFEKTNAYLISNLFLVFLEIGYSSSCNKHVQKLLGIAEKRMLENHGIYAAAIELFEKNSFHDLEIVLEVLTKYYQHLSIFEKKDQEIAEEIVTLYNIQMGSTKIFYDNPEVVFNNAIRCIEKSYYTEDEIADFIKRANDIKVEHAPKQPIANVSSGIAENPYLTMFRQITSLSPKKEKKVSSLNANAAEFVPEAVVKRP